MPLTHSTAPIETRNGIDMPRYSTGVRESIVSSSVAWERVSVSSLPGSTNRN